MKRNDDRTTRLRPSRLSHPSHSKSKFQWTQEQFDGIKHKLYTSMNRSNSKESWPSDRDDCNLFDADRKRKRVRRVERYHLGVTNLVAVIVM